MVRRRQVRFASTSIALAIAVAAMVPGCATGYQASGFGGGYSETVLAENVFQVSFRGNGYTSAERVADLSLLRCAELCLERGYAHFLLVDATESATLSTYTTSSRASTTGTITGAGNTAFLSTQTTVTPGTTHVYVKPSRMNTIVCFKEKPEGQGLALDARFVSDSIRSKYQIPHGG